MSKPKPEETTSLLEKGLPEDRPDGLAAERAGQGLMLLSTIGFGGMAILERVAQSRLNLATSHAVLIRGFVQVVLALLLTPWLGASWTRMSGGWKTKALLTIRGVVGGVAVWMGMGALARIPAGDETAIFFTCPVMVMILAWIILGEPMSKFDVVAAATSLVGGFLVSSPSFWSDGDNIPVESRTIGSALALGAAFASAMVYVILRNLRSSIHYLASVLTLGFSATILGLILMTIRGELSYAAVPKDAAGVMVIASFFGFCGQMSMNRGIQLCRAGPGTLLRNIDVPLVYLLSVLFLHEAPSLTRVLGATLVVASAVIVAAQRR